MMETHNKAKDDSFAFFMPAAWLAKRQAQKNPAHWAPG